MKRFLIMFMVVGLVAGSVATAEAKGTKRPTRVERTVEGSYGPYSSLVTGCNDPDGSLACFVVNTRSTEAFFTAKVTDAHGQPVFVHVSNGGNGATFCGETTRPVSFDPGSRLYFRTDPMTNFWSDSGLGVGPLDCPYRLKTTGTISVTLSNQP